MKLLLENWREYLTEGSENKRYFWQTRGPWKAESQIDFGVTHVPRAKPREHESGLIEEIFEEVRKEKFPDRPSRLNSVFLCENLEGFAGGSFCTLPARRGGETYEVELRGNYNIFKTDSEYWTEAVWLEGDEENARRWAEAYWKGSDRPSFAEILVSPPEAAIIVGKYEK
jgi:hypothetical protein